MAETETEITREELQKEIEEILNHASLENTSTKKVIQKLEKKLGMDLTEKKSMIDQLVMDYVNSMDSDEDSADEQPPAKMASKKKVKKEDDEEDDEEEDDSNDSDWGYYHHDGHLLDGYSDDDYRPTPQESNVLTSESRRLSNRPRAALILKRVAPTPQEEEDEAEIFGKLTAKKLRKLSDEKRDFLMIKINQLFYDKCHKKRRMVEKSTSTMPTVQYETKKLYRVGSLPKNSPPAIPIALSHAVVSLNNKTKTLFPPSSVLESFVQVPTTSKPIVKPTKEVATKNNSTSHYGCGVM